MWQVIAQVVSKFLPTQQEVAERKVKEMLVHLYLLVTDCSQSYREWRKDPTDARYAIWQTDVECVIRLLEELSLTLASKWPGAYEAVHEYALSEAPPMEGDPTQMEILSRLQDLALHKSQLRQPESKEIGSAADRLRDVIGEHLQPGEIQKVRGDYPKWKESWKQTAPK